MRAYLERYGAEDTSALISYASALVDKYGEGARSWPARCTTPWPRPRG